MEMGGVQRTKKKCKVEYIHIWTGIVTNKCSKCHHLRNSTQNRKTLIDK